MTGNAAVPSINSAHAHMAPGGDGSLVLRGDTQSHNALDTLVSVVPSLISA